MPPAMRFLTRLLLLLLLLPAASVQADPAVTRLRIPEPLVIEPTSIGGYYLAALRLALEKTAAAGEAMQIVHVGTPGVPRERYRRLLAEGEIDLMWSSSTPERETLLEPVRFNLLKGINEQRVLLVRRADLGRFADIKSLAQLRRLRAGAGLHWSDAQILRANGLTVVTASLHDSLFKMLAQRRFDYMPRTLAEIDDDLRAHPGLDLTVEPGLMLRYRQPIYFFVGKGNKALAERLLRGLELASADGSLDRAFFATPALKSSWEQLKSHKRTVLQLESL
jgi:hypothetical protein